MNEVVMFILLAWFVSFLAVVATEVVERLKKRFEKRERSEKIISDEVVDRLLGYLVTSILLFTFFLCLPYTLYLIWKGDIDIKTRR